MYATSRQLTDLEDDETYFPTCNNYYIINMFQHV